MNPAISFKHVSKHYRLGTGQGSLRDAVSNLVRRLVDHNGVESDQSGHWALREVSFDVMPGQALALIGPNGAGKTTTLKLLSQITRPTSGQIRVNGKLSALIELGAGFHQDLTGRENVLLNGTILGLKRRQIAEMMDSIIAFAGLEKFIDTPVKRYSSGMYVRLGFAIAAHIDPDILLVDEVLAVGDMAFQRKCLDKMSELCRRGKAVVLVSHNMRAVQSLCTHALWLDKGQIQMLGPVQEVVASYTNATNEVLSREMLSSRRHAERWGSGEVRITQVRLLNANGAPGENFDMGDRLTLEIHYQTEKRIVNPSFDVAIFASNGVRVCTAHTRLSGQKIDDLQSSGVVRCILDEVPLIPGSYSVTAAIYDQDDLKPYDRWGNVCGFVINARPLGEAKWYLSHQHHGVVYLPARWEI